VPARTLQIPPAPGEAMAETARVDRALREEFDEHAERWMRDTDNSSSIRVAVIHPSYQRIIEMGKPALPLIFERLAANPAPWFAALRTITGEDPVDPRDAGRVARMAEAWLAWARDRKLTR
jgi:hypothetical protein